VYTFAIFHTLFAIFVFSSFCTETISYRPQSHRMKRNVLRSWNTTSATTADIFVAWNCALYVVARRNGGKSSCGSTTSSGARGEDTCNYSQTVRRWRRVLCVTRTHPDAVASGLGCQIRDGRSDSEGRKLLSGLEATRMGCEVCWSCSDVECSSWQLDL
jgi:hypothetical protein